METFVADAEILGQILKTLVENAHQDVKEAVFTSADGENSFDICLIPPNTKHLLNHVVGRSESSFFLVGKASESEDPAVKNGESPALQRFQNERVPVGTSISQGAVFYLCGSEPLHSSHGQSQITDCFLSPGVIQPVSLESARYLLSLHGYVSRNGAIYGSFPFWVFVDGNNPQNVTFMATVPENAPEVKLAQPMQRKKVKSSGQAHVVFSCSSEAQNIKDVPPDFNTYREQHLSNCKGVRFVETHGYALYEVMGSANIDIEDVQHSKILVEFVWDQVTALLEVPPHSCDGVVHIRCVPGNEHLSTYPLYLELQRVEQFFELLDDEEIPWPASSGDASEPVSDKMTAFLEKLDSGSVFSPIAAGDSTITSPLRQLTFSEFTRKDLDFTERLWLILKDTCDEEDLTTSFQIMLSALFSGECQPVVHTTNKTPFAELIRDLLQCEKNELRQQLQERAQEYTSIIAAIECLVEIGTDKLRRDYAQFLFQEELATMGQLTLFLNSKLSTLGKVSNIRKLHQTIELVSMAKSLSKIGHENVRALTQQALAFYSNHSADDLPIFSLSLPAFGSPSGTAVKGVCTDLQPSVWCVTMKSKTKKGDHTTVVQFSTNHPCKLPCTTSFEPNESNLGEEVFSSDSVKNKSTYYVSCARKIILNLNA